MKKKYKRPKVRNWIALHAINRNAGHHGDAAKENRNWRQTNQSLIDEYYDDLQEELSDDELLAHLKAA